MLRVTAPLREILLVLLVISGILAAATTAAEEVSVATVLQGLKNPCGVAIRPGGAASRYEVFVADTGAGRIVRITSGKPATATDVITGFSTTGSGSNPLATSGPRGLLFLGPRYLLVVCGSGDEPDSLRLYELPEAEPEAVGLYEPSSDDAPLKADQAEQTITADAQGDAPGHLGRLYALARTQINRRVPDEIVVTALGGAGRGWLGKSQLRSGSLGDLQPFTADGEELVPISPAGIVVSEKGYVVVGQLGARDKPGDSVLEFYTPTDGRRVLALRTGLHDLAGLAYSHETQNLYASDLAAADPNQGGVFRIDDASRLGEPAGQAVRIATLQRPTALVFGPDGSLWVAACGAAEGQGVVVRLTGGEVAL